VQKAIAISWSMHVPARQCSGGSIPLCGGRLAGLLKGVVPEVCTVAAGIALGDRLNHARPMLSAGEWIPAKPPGRHPRRRLAACGSVTMLIRGWFDSRSQYFTMRFPQQTKEHEHGQAR
jgi:hypothetical protein